MEAKGEAAGEGKSEQGPIHGNLRMESDGEDRGESVDQDSLPAHQEEGAKAFLGQRENCIPTTKHQGPKDTKEGIHPALGALGFLGAGGAPR